MASNNANSNKRIAKNTIFLYIRMGLVLIVSLFTTRIVLNALGIEDYGIQNVVSGFVTMFSFLNTSMANGIQRFYSYSLGYKKGYSIKDIYNASLQIQGLLALVLLILLETFGIWYIKSQMVIPTERLFAASWVFQFSVFSLLILVFSIPFSAAIMAYERMTYYAYLSIFDVLAKLGVAYAIMYATTDKLILYGACNLLVSIANFLLCYLYSKQQFKELKVNCTVRKQILIPMFSFSGWNILGSFAYMVKNQGLNMLLNVFFGPFINAARGISSMVMSAIQSFQSNIVIAFRPQLVQSYAAGDNSRVQNLFFSLSKVSYILLCVMSIPIIIEIEYILHLWLGDSVPEYTIPFTILVLVNMVVSSLNTPVSQVVHAIGKMSYYQICTSFMVGAILPVSWIFLKIGCNPTSVYWISLAITILNQVVCVLILKKIYTYSLKNYCKKVIIPCMKLSAIVPILPLSITLLFPPSFLRLLVTSIVSSIIAIIVSYFFVLERSEKNMVLKYLKQKA